MSDKTVHPMQKNYLLTSSRLRKAYLVSLGIGLMVNSCKPWSSAQVPEPLAHSPVPGAGITNSPPSSSDGEFIDPTLPESVVGAVFQTIALQYQVPAVELSISTAVVQLWPDGCLGLPKPDEVCTQAMTSGWELTVNHKGQQWVYRTDEEGTQVRLAAGEPQTIETIEPLTPSP